MPSYERTGEQSRAGSSGRTVPQVRADSSLEDKTFGWSRSDEVAIYDKWANLYTGYDDYFKLNSYFDYFFTGQDIQVFIEGLTDPGDILPIYQFGYNIQQNKQPLYGCWSYTYDYMLRGNRILSGVFSIIPPGPGYMTSKVAKAASVRANRTRHSSLFPVRGLNEDDANIETYWRKNYDSNLDADQKHLFSIHPPFNFVIVYGVQDTSLEELSSSGRIKEVREKFRSSTAMMGDINERLVEADQESNEMRVLIENVELISRQTEYTPEGDPIIETYSFMARDIREAPTSRAPGTTSISPTSGSASNSGGGRVKPPGSGGGSGGFRS